MGDLQLQGSKGFIGKEAPIQHRQVNQGVSPAQIIKATEDNNLDEIIVADKTGTMHVVYADELSVKNGKHAKEGTQVNLPFTNMQMDVADGFSTKQSSYPKIGDKVYLPFIEDQVTVLHVDNEMNEDYSFLTAGLVGIWMNKNGGSDGDDSAILKLTHKPGQAPVEKPDTTPSPDKPIWEIPKDFVPYSPEKLQSETAWALELEKKVHSGGGHTPEEEKRYRDVYFALKTDPANK